MCFSASASFTAGAFLVPISVYAVYSSVELKRYHYIMLSLVPLFFGIQQLIEGGVWLAIAANSPHYIHLFSLGFLFFFTFLLAVLDSAKCLYDCQESSLYSRLDYACLCGGWFYIGSEYLHPFSIAARCCANYHVC